MEHQGGRVVLRSIKQHDVFWECQGGKNALLVATADARAVDVGTDHEGTEVDAMETLTGQKVRLYQRLQPLGYGSGLYTYPAYHIHIDEYTRLYPLLCERFGDTIADRARAQGLV